MATVRKTLSAALFDLSCVPDSDLGKVQWQLLSECDHSANAVLPEALSRFFSWRREGGGQRLGASGTWGSPGQLIGQTGRRYWSNRAIMLVKQIARDRVSG